jgi:hypothetical protein
MCLLFAALLPVVQQQVASQIKVRDFSNAKLTISPADSTSWADVRTELIAEKKAALRAELECHLAANTDESDIQAIRRKFSAKERAIEAAVDSEVHTFSATIDVEYNFLA